MKQNQLIMPLVCLILIFGVYSVQADNQNKSKLNFILFIADDVSWDGFACYGNNVVKTPNIDKLAAQGICFDNAFLTASSCSPSRCSIASGKYPHSNGAPELHLPLPASQIPFPLLLKEDGYYTVLAGKSHLGKFAHRAFDIHLEGKRANGPGGEENWVKFLNERPKDKPFMMWYAAYDAHRPWSTDINIADHKPENVKVPPYFADTPETRQDIIAYYDEISRFDYYIGEVCKELKKQGELENTFIIVMADNGMAFPRCKTRVYDSGMRTPFVVYAPTILKNKGNRTESLVSSIDIAPTILELAGLETPDDFQGTSFFPVLKNPENEIRNEVFSDHNWHDYEAHERMMRTKDFLYVLNARPNLTNCGPADSKGSPTQAALNALRDKSQLSSAQADVFVSPRPAEELFDVKNDPLQLVNLASHPKYQKQLKEMRKALKQWQKETGDTTPENLTGDWRNRETGEKMDNYKVRGEAPGRKVE